MISANVTLQGFDASVHEATQDQLNDAGEPTGERFPIKLLRFMDSNSGFAFHAVFSPEQFDQFVKQMQKHKSTVIHLPKGTRPFWHRNGD